MTECCPLVYYATKRVLLAMVLFHHSVCPATGRWAEFSNPGSAYAATISTRVLPAFARHAITPA